MLKNIEDNKESAPLKASSFGIRHIQVVLLFSLLAVAYGMRINLSVGIVAMTDPTINPDVATYDWSISTKSTMLSSFFWGYVIPQIGAGQLAERYGPRWFLVVTMSLTTLFSVLIPPLAEYGPWAVMSCRMIQGFGQGFFFPSIQFLLSKWVPTAERSRMAAFVYAGGPLGTVIAMPITGWLSASSLGWPSVFYLYGIIGAIWVVLWFLLGSNDPSEHKTISEKERKYIQESTGDSSVEVKQPTPWKHIFKSLPVWGIVVAYSGQHWGYWTLMTEIPTYMNSILNFNISTNGLLSAAPYFALWLASFFFSYMSDMFINRNILTIAGTRKLASAIGLIGPAIALIILGSISSPERAEALSLLIVAVAINAAIFSGHQVNHIDISPKFSATLMGLSNGVGNIFSIIAPLMVQFIVTDESDPGEWRMVFYIAAGIYVISDIFFTFTAKGELQYWDKLEENKESKDSNS